MNIVEIIQKRHLGYLMVKHKEQLKNIETLKVKEIKEILGKTEKQEIFGQYLQWDQHQTNKFNYRIATNILKTAMNRKDKRPFMLFL